MAYFYRYKFLLFLKGIKKPVPFLGEKKAQQSRKTVLGTSQVLLLLSFK
ncbi:hypothetical protein J455_4301 [Acinetobacter baumannii 17534]|nr:hypothetical protein J455_4301 [Acinetobacter baumannii 17534]